MALPVPIDDEEAPAEEDCVRDQKDERDIPLGEDKEGEQNRDVESDEYRDGPHPRRERQRENPSLHRLQGRLGDVVRGLLLLQVHGHWHGVQHRHDEGADGGGGEGKKSKRREIESGRSFAKVCIRMSNDVFF